MTDYAELVKRLRKLMMCEATMRDWDGWRKYIANGGGASWPRDSFESYLETRDEEAAEAADAIEAQAKRIAELEAALEYYAAETAESGEYWICDKDGVSITTFSGWGNRAREALRK